MRASLSARFQYPGTTALEVEWHRLLSSDMGDEVLGFPWWTSGKESACNAGDQGSTPGLGKSPGEGNGNPLQYSCLENPGDRGAWRATVHRVAKSQTRLSDITHSLTHSLNGRMGSMGFPGSSAGKGSIIMWEMLLLLLRCFSCVQLCATP